MGRTVLAAVVAAVTLAAPPSSTADEGPYIAGEGFSAAQVTLIEWALSRFADAGLELPHLEFELHDQREPCRGARGFYTGDGSTVRICMPGTGNFAQSLYLHEIAHAWDDHALSDGRRSAFLEARGLETWWDDGTAAWHTFGAEHAAQIVMWGLIDRPIRLATIPDTGCEALRTGYTLLTGHPPLHDFAEGCDELPAPSRSDLHGSTEPG